MNYYLLNEDPSEMEFQRTVFNAFMNGIETADPGFIVEYNPDTKLADVQIAPRKALPLEQIGTRTFEDKGYEDQIVIPQIPVVFPSFSNKNSSGILHFPLEAGSPGIIIFCKNTTRNYNETGGIYEPSDNAKHNMNGAFFIPGGLPTPNNVKNTSSTNLELIVNASNGKTSKIQIDTGNGNINIESKGTIDINGGAVNVGGDAEAIIKGDTLTSLIESIFGLVLASGVADIATGKVTFTVLPKATDFADAKSEIAKTK